MSTEELRREDDRLIGALVQKVDQLIVDVSDVKSSIKWQNGRVRKLEGWRNVILGAWMATTILISAMMYLFKEYLHAAEEVGKLLKLLP